MLLGPSDSEDGDGDTILDGNDPPKAHIDDDIRRLAMIN
jgi:hypothetical protein